MPDLDTILREALAERAEQVQARPEAVAAAVSAVRGRRRWRQGAVAVGAAAAAAVVAVGAVTLWPHQDAVSPVPATPSVPSSSATPSPPADATATASTGTPSAQGNPSGDRFFQMSSLFGGDFEKGVQSSGFGGDLVLKAGSPSSTGLPSGYSASLALDIQPAISVAYDGAKSTITDFCQPMVEKGATTKACVPYAYGGKVLQRSATDAPNTKVGTWALSRMLYVRPDGQVEMTTMTVFNTARSTTPHDRDLAAAWLSSQADKLAALTVADQR